VCAVAAQPGHTKELQSVQLERGLRIADSPGVIFRDTRGSTSASVRINTSFSGLIGIQIFLARFRPDLMGDPESTRIEGGASGDGACS
jgi:hypothetical protein